MNLRQKNKALKRQIESLEVLLNTFKPNVIRPVCVNTIRVEEYKTAIPFDLFEPPHDFESNMRNVAEILYLKSKVRDKLFEEISPNIEYKITEQAVVGSLFVGKRGSE